MEIEQVVATRRQRRRIAVGDKHGHLVVTGFTCSGPDRRVVCKCSCGVIKSYLGCNLGDNPNQSCGCIARKLSSLRVKANPPRKIHGESSSPTYMCWRAMVDRCSNPKHGGYPTYGGVGIMVCRRWSDPITGYENFVADMGRRPGKEYSIDRIDGSGDYCPSNCRWATSSQQKQNREWDSRNKTGYRGVCFYTWTSRNQWGANIGLGGENIPLGRYATKEEAAYAYNLGSKALHGKYGCPNPDPELPESVRASIEAVVSTYLQRHQNRSA